MTRNDPSLLTHSKTTKCRSAENLLNICETRGASVDDVDGQVFSDVTTDDDDKPPPKPPKPHYLWNVGKFNRSERFCLILLSYSLSFNLHFIIVVVMKKYRV